MENIFSDLGNTVNINKKLEELEKIVSKQHTNVKNTSEKLGKVETNVKDFEKVILKCTKCDYTTTSENGLKTHMTRKHLKAVKNIENKSFPRKCDLCECELKRNVDKKLQMKNHSYKLIQYKCEECDFCGTNSMTMDVQQGKEHTENL